MTRNMPREIITCNPKVKSFHFASMNAATDSAAIPLAAPGAGLPAIELWIAKRMVGLARWRIDRRQAAELIVRERAALLGLAGRCSAEQGRRRVLIKRPLGMEDSSRFWSVYMTLEHVRIVNESVVHILRELSAGRVPEGAASTAAVKPSPDAGPEAMAGFDRSCAALQEVEPEIRETNARYAHPWFGPMDTHGWHVMAGFHTRLHRGQIETILRALHE